MGRWSHFDYIFFFQMGGWLNHQLLYGFVVVNLRYEECIKMNKKNRSAINLPAPPQKNPAAMRCFTKSGLNNSKSQQKESWNRPWQSYSWSHLTLEAICHCFWLGCPRGVLHPCCQGDAARIGSIYGPLLLGENRRGEVIRHPFFDPGKFQPDLEGKEVHGISAG